MQPKTELVTFDSGASNNNNGMPSDPDAAITTLPDEILYHIVSFLTQPRDLCMVSRVCVRWRRVSTDDGLWRTMHARCESIVPGTLKDWPDSEKLSWYAFVDCCERRSRRLAAELGTLTLPVRSTPTPRTPKRGTATDDAFVYAPWTGEFSLESD
eukprot:TRINITY_DN9553_c0_g1_i2.p1 TRINITY_DN9553_c0_g1~~TRINITY_DN9553_c0_g1_i2.p1  ORF type:complete len:155 (+),score=5.64 TRINITY_DN9553_c0_g1_i2:164-628(+)